MTYVSLHPTLLTELVVWSAKHSTSVEQVIREAILAYMADVDCGLLSRPKEMPRYLAARLRQKA